MRVFIESNRLLLRDFRRTNCIFYLIFIIILIFINSRIENNCVEFTLSTKEGTGKNLDVNFNKLAIKALHMKSIKQQLEPNMDVMLKKMHMVSLGKHELF